MFAPTPDLKSIYLPGVAAAPRPGVYRDLIAAARSNGTEYGKIWELFAFQDFTVHLARFTHGVLEVSIPKQPEVAAKRVVVEAA